MNTFWRSKGSKAWVITSAIILILILAVNIASSAFFDTVCIVLNSPQRTKLINEQNQYIFWKDTIPEKRQPNTAIR